MGEQLLVGEQRKTSEPAHSFEVRVERLNISTGKRVQLLDITPRLAACVRQSGIRNGIALVNSLHTTVALFINEFQEALLDDIRIFLEQVVVRGNSWRHNDPKFSNCDRSNAEAHLRAMLLGHSLALPVQDGEFVLGSFQSVILAELDGPRERALHVQILGSG